MGTLCVLVFNIGVIVCITNISIFAQSFVKPPPLSTGLPNQAFCVDLTFGKRSYLPKDTTNVRWVTYPTSDADRCNIQGVLRILPPLWSNCVYFHMTFEDASAYSFNLGDSPGNKGGGGGGVFAGGVFMNPFISDAEIWGYNSNINVYGRTQCGLTEFVSNNEVVKSAMVIELGRRRFHIKNYAGYSHGTTDDGLFTYKSSTCGDYLYLGLNRVVHNLHGSPYQGRTGRGLCSVCIYFQEYCHFDPPLI